MLPNDAVHTGHRLVEFTQGEEEEGSSAVKCVFKKVSGGEERFLEVETPLLLGADGIHSEARKHLLSGAAGEGVSARDNGRTIGRAIIDSSLCLHPVRAPLPASCTCPSARTLYVPLLPHPVNTILGVNRTATAADCGAGKLFWACTLIDSADPTVSSVRSKGGEEVREKILRAFEGWDVVQQVVKATPPDLILERRVLDLPPLPFWVKGRTALLGGTVVLGGMPLLGGMALLEGTVLLGGTAPLEDAAHAVTPGLGQGANLAFEDAAQLVECLRGKTHVRWVLHFSGRVLHL
ncbi:unnamed protein product [Closterium sp. Naga37s-1]|nr:unnamed protein product [Closterium sp. Naga37s-1]